MNPEDFMNYLNEGDHLIAFSKKFGAFTVDLNQEILPGISMLSMIESAFQGQLASITKPYAMQTNASTSRIVDNQQDTNNAEGEMIYGGQLMTVKQVLTEMASSENIDKGRN